MDVSVVSARSLRNVPTRIYIYPLILGFLSIFITLPLWRLWSGDAVIHLIYGINGSTGEWFQYNLGETSLGTTSIGWTMWLSLSIRVLGLPTTMLVQKLVLGFCVALVPLLIYKFLRSQHHTHAVALAVTSLAILNPGYLYNAPLGMENPVFAVLVALVMSTSLLPSKAVCTSWGKTIAAGCLLGLSASLRPEGALVFAIFSLLATYRVGRTGKLGLTHETARLGILLACFLVCYLPFLLFQYSETGVLFGSTSAQARLMSARRSSVLVGPIAFDPTLTIRLLMYAPLTLCIVATVVLFARRRWRGIEDTLKTSLLLVIVFVLFYSFVSGASHYARYTMFLLLPFAGLAAEGFRAIQSAVPVRSVRNSILAAMLLWLTSVYIVETVLRVRDNFEFITGTTYSFDSLVDAARPSQKLIYTDRFMAELPTVSSQQLPIRVAFVEVQARYWLDERVEIVSVDGRTAPLEKPIPFFTSGTVIESAFLERFRPDYIAEWLAVPSMTTTHMVAAGSPNIRQMLRESPSGSSLTFDSGIQIVKLTNGMLSVDYTDYSS